MRGLGVGEGWKALISSEGLLPTVWSLPSSPASTAVSSEAPASLSFPFPPAVLLGRKRRTKHAQKGLPSSSEHKLLVILRSDCGNERQGQG